MKSRGRMTQDSYAVWKIRLDRREERLLDLENGYASRIKQNAKDLEIRRRTGEDFYKEQAQYYQQCLPRIWI